MKFLFVSNRSLFILFLLLWLLVQAILFIKLGLRTSVDSELYLLDSRNLLNGLLPKGRNFWYVSYSAFLAFVFFLGGNNTTVALVQIFLSGVAAFCLYQVAMETYAHRNVAVLAVLLYLLWIKIHEWNAFLYTESLFTSCSIISFAALQKSKSVWQYLLAGLLFMFTIFIRPTGFALAVGLFCYGLCSVKREYLKRVFSLGLIGGVGLVLFLVSMLENFTLIESYAKAEVIYPNITLGLKIPTDIHIPDNKYSTLVRVSFFALHNPIYFLKLFFLKLLLFLGNVKPYFSTLHNAVIVLVLYPLYFFAVKGFLRYSDFRKENYFIAGFVITQVLTVALTSENWDGRFLIPVLPFIFFLAAAGIISTLKFRKKPSYRML